MIDIEVRKVKVECSLCNNIMVTNLIFGENEKYPDDFSIECPSCDNWEEGALPLQSFTHIDTLGHYEYSVNATKHFTPDELVKYSDRAQISKEYSYSPDDVLQASWLEPREGEDNKGKDYVVHRADYVIASGLSELEADILLDELQAECNE